MFLSIVTAQIVDLQFSWAIEIRGGNLTFLFGNVYSLMSPSQPSFSGFSSVPTYTEN